MNKHSVWAAIAIVLGIVALAFVAFPSAIHSQIPQTDEDRFISELNDLSVTDAIRMSDLGSLVDYSVICIVPPYAIRASDSKGSLRKIFDSISYEDRAFEISTNASDDAIVTLYPIRDDGIASAIRIARRKLELTDGINAGCYETRALCLENRSSEDVSSLRITTCQSN